MIVIDLHESHWGYYHNKNSHHYYLDSNDDDDHIKESGDAPQNNFSDRDEMAVMDDGRSIKHIYRQRKRIARTWSSHKLTVLEAIIDQSPGCSSIPHGESKRLPIHSALDANGNDNNCTTTNISKRRNARMTWDDGISLLVHDAPTVLCKKDVKTGLYAFALAAAAQAPPPPSSSKVKQFHTTLDVDENDRNVDQNDYDKIHYRSSNSIQNNANENSNCNYDVDQIHSPNLSDIVCLDTVYMLLLSDPTVLESSK
jgi:hypothetical protein